MINQTLNSSYNIGSSSSYRPFYASSVATHRNNFEARYNLPYNRYAAEYVKPLNDQQTEQELRQLLESIQEHEEHTKPEDRVGTPDRLAVNLMEHQKVGLRWMTRQEESVNKGGMLSDDMGLGKTVQAMALIVSRPCEDPTPITRVASIMKMRRTDKSQAIKVKATLVVCPVSLIAQWERELVVKTRPSLKVLVHHGSNRTIDERKFMEYDAVVTAYTTVANEVQEFEERCGPLSRVQWHRVFLDEAHQIKNKRTRMAEGCCRLESQYRWCLTATPIQNKIEELYSIIKFLRIRPYCEWKEFSDEIDRPMRKGKHKHALRKTQVLLKAISLRRSKKAKIDGKPILNLPERNVHFTHIDFTPDERQFYEFVNANAQASFNKFVEAGTVMKNYSSVLVLLLRLRQACLHPSLTMMEAPTIDSAASEEERREVVKAMDPQVVQRLVQSDDLKEIECPICMDLAAQAQIISQCGHVLCRECLTNYINTGDANDKRCPQCRGPLKTDKVVSVEMFLQVHAPDQFREAMEDITAAKDKEEEMAKNPDKVFHSSAKIDKMLEILHDTRRETKNQDKTIIFSQFTSMLDLLERPLRENEFKFVRFDGTMSVANRDKALGVFFEDPNCTVLLVSTKCGSLGLNLTVANRVILMDIWWNPALENQAIDRVHRIGQRKAVDVHRIFVNNTVEDRILELQRKKQAIADGALGEGSAQKIGRLGFNELLHLFRGTGLPDDGIDSVDDDA
ncbi:hypothetical protein K492DRAFT_137057 [Lichtheimia hyalospora FSU 10163]|nr:hypothetical protein K492DRAFT_137057 [Lichtheimia hyalospora FSU 10163]